MSTSISANPSGLSGLNNTNLLSPSPFGNQPQQSDPFANDIGAIDNLSSALSSLAAVSPASGRAPTQSALDVGTFIGQAAMGNGYSRCGMSALMGREPSQSDVDADLLTGRLGQGGQPLQGSDSSNADQGLMNILTALIELIVKLFRGEGNQDKNPFLDVVLDGGQGGLVPSGPANGGCGASPVGQAGATPGNAPPPSGATPGGNVNNGGPVAKAGPTSMPEPKGTEIVNATIVVKAGEVFDGGGKLYKAGPRLGDGSQNEHQKPVFKIEPGGVVKNLQYEGADGIHCMGDAKIQDVWCRDVGEDALTMTGKGNVTWSGGGAFGADDAIFQLNAGGSFTLENFKADGFGKAIRTNGGKNIDIDITVKNSDFQNGKEAIVRTDARDTRIKLEGVTFDKVPNDVLAPSFTRVDGAVKRGSKQFKG